VSAVGYYPPSKDLVYDEYSSPETTDYMSKLCLDWEDAGKLPESHNHVQQVIVRSGEFVQNFR